MANIVTIKKRNDALPRALDQMEVQVGRQQAVTELKEEEVMVKNQLSNELGTRPSADVNVILEVGIEAVVLVDNRGHLVAQAAEAFGKIRQEAGDFMGTYQDTHGYFSFE
jgi:hypothetical protein